MKQLNKDISQEEIERVREIGKRFLLKYGEEIDEIVSIMPKIVGKNWRKESGKEIEVYFVDWKGPSFSHPLTLKVRKDLLLMLVVLTHELGHHIIPKEEGYHEKINNIMEKVFEKLKIDVQKQIAWVKEKTEK